MAAERWRKRLNIQGEDVARAFDEGFAKLDLKRPWMKVKIPVAMMMRKDADKLLELFD